MPFCGLFHDADSISSCHNLLIGKDPEGSGCSQMKFLEALRKTTKKLRIAGVPVAIQTEHLQNTILERYRYTSLLDISSYITTKLLP
jgi:hypothetical protein